MSDHYVTVEEIEKMEKKVMKNHVAIEKASLRIYNIIDPMILNDEKVVLFEIFGIGNFNEEKSIIQVQVALSLLQRLKKKNGKVRVTSREPNHNDAEEEYLEKNGIEVREVGFTTKDYLKASKGTQNPILICYMIHGTPDMYEDFIATHYNHINQVIFIGNEPKWILKFLKASENLEMIDKVFASTDPKPLDMTDTCISYYVFCTTCIYRTNI